MEGIHELLYARAVNQSNDSNVGSSQQKASNSLSGMLTSLVTNGLVFLAIIGAFLILRKSQKRIYSPRTYMSAIPKERRVEPLPSGALGWFKGLLSKDEDYVLSHTSLDAYFFLRYLKVASTVCLVGCFITWPILFPINALGGGGSKQLDLVNFSNIDKSSHKNYYYAHALVAWVFFAFVMFTIYRELMHYTAIRHAYLLHPMYADRISSRTVLITSIPENYMNVPALLKMFDGVTRIWINTNIKELEEAVKERDKVAGKLEGAEAKYIRLADKNRRAAIKKGNAPEGDAEQGSIGSRWVPQKKRPTNRLKPIIGKKVDTITWGREELVSMNNKVAELQARQRTDQVKQLNSAFIEFTSQSAAQAAVQCLAHNRPLHMAPRYIGISPDEVVWANLRLLWWERLVRIVLTTVFLVALVIFWSIPVAITGSISNIQYLTDKVHFLSFINKCPKVILGLITGLLPSVMLAILMALLPIILRLMAKLAGAPSLSQIELSTQNSYFAFQVVQVFLVATLSSAASAAVTSIIKDPSSVTSLLANNLPKASNFYISYLILQGLSVSALALLQIVGLILSKILGRILDGTPRKMWKRWNQLSGIGWGTLFPIYTNLFVIALTYAMIAPLILAFASIGLIIFYLAFKYNFLYVYNSQIDTKGLCYPKALYQTFTGIYIAEICLIGLFGICTAPGPLILTVILAIFTVLYHIALVSAFSSVLYYLPRNLEEEERSLLSREQSNGVGRADGAGKDGAVDGEETLVVYEEPPKANFIVRYLKPQVYCSFHHARRMLPKSYPVPIYSAEDRENAYVHPALAARTPILWIPRDEAGVSQEEIAASQEVTVEMSDEYAWIDEKSKLQWSQDVEGKEVNPPDYEEKAQF